MHIAKVHLVGTTPYSQSKHVSEEEHPKKNKESPDDYENRTWMHRMHVNADGNVFIPMTSFTAAIRTSAKRLRIRVPGKGQTEFGKYFEAGIDACDDLVLPIKADDVRKERLFVPSDGKPGGGKRVYRNFPRIDKWEGDMVFYVLDDLITEDVFSQVLRSAGLLVGIGRFRPENRGFYGRFKVSSLEWIEDGEAALNAAA
jgi:hypothetical protein